ncbi:MAG TPA: YihY/virulence factor BrkB family protein [Candidatus Limnocylindrales bacterium]|nr:YihY/virulence factor BrkB family protein [Candidatus Limnocylindrales bacterium]
MKLINLAKIRQEAQTLLDESNWRSQKELSQLHKFLHFCVLVWTSFSRNRCPARASALAYANLLALVPMLAVVLGITSSFLKSEGEQRIDRFVVKGVLSVVPRSMFSTNALAVTTNWPSGSSTEGEPATTQSNSSAATNAVSSAQLHKHGLLPSASQEQQVLNARREIAHRIHEFIRNTRSSALGVTGTIALIFAAIAMLSQIETTFNDIWGTVQGRSYFTRIAVYWTILTLGPLMLAVALGFTTGQHWGWTQKLLVRFPFAATLIFRIIPVVVLCLGLAVFYRLMPNAKVHWNAALVGGLVGGSLWHLNNLISVLYVSRVVSNSVIYGSLGLVPVFMIGLYLIWWIVLFGAQVAYAFQNRASFLEQQQVEQMGQRGRELLALRLIAWIGRRFMRGEPPVSVFEMAKQLEVPTRLVLEVIHQLCKAHLVIPAVGSDVAYTPARPLRNVTCQQILAAMRAGPGQRMAHPEEPTASRVFRLFRRIEHAEARIASKITLQELAEVSRIGLPKQEPVVSAEQSSSDNDNHRMAAG